VLEEPLIADPASIFFKRFHLTFLDFDMKHTFKAILTNNEATFLHKPKHYKYIFYKVLNGNDVRFSL
jgi:hypothetical protein